MAGASEEATEEAAEANELAWDQALMMMLLLLPPMMKRMMMLLLLLVTVMPLIASCSEEACANEGGSQTRTMKQQPQHQGVWKPPSSATRAACIFASASASPRIMRSSESCF